MKTLCTILAALGLFGLVAIEGQTFAATLTAKVVSLLLLLPAGIVELKERRA